MTIRRPRLTVRLLMIVVALAGALLAVVVLRERRERYRQEAVKAELWGAVARQRVGEQQFAVDDWAVRATEYRELSAHSSGREKASNDYQVERSIKEMREAQQRLAVYQVRVAYFRDRQERYERAASRPWLTAAADPPEPPEPS